MGIFGLFSRFWPFWPFSAVLDLLGTLPRGGFYINPSRRGPAVPKKAFSGPSPGGAQKPHFWGIFGEIPGFRGFRAPGPQRALRTAPGNRGAPARGVDVKPPSPGRRDPVPGVPRPPGWPGSPSGPPGGSGSPPGPPQGALGPLPGLPGRGFYINPSRRGPAVPGGPLPGPGAGRPPSSGGGAGEEPPPLICRGGGGHRRGWPRG